MPITLRKQLPIIHNRKAYGGARNALPECYEWTKQWVAWETELHWLVEIPSSITGQFPHGRPRSERVKIPDGLSLNQKVTFVDELYDTESHCGTVTVVQEEVFPLSPYDSQIIKDPHIHGWRWRLLCGEKPAAPGSPPRLTPDLLLCHIESTVTCELKFVIAKESNTGRGIPENGGVADVYHSSYQLTVGSRTGTTRHASRKVPLDISSTDAEGDDGEEATHKYKASVDHCTDWKTLNMEDVPSDRNISAVANLERKIGGSAIARIASDPVLRVRNLMSPFGAPGAALAAMWMSRSVRGTGSLGANQIVMTHIGSGDAHLGHEHTVYPFVLADSRRLSS